MVSATADGDRASRCAPRWHIDSGALSVLEAVFQLEQFPNIETRKQLGIDLRVSSRQVQVWFQNRRQRERKYRSLAESRAADDPFAQEDRPMLPPVGASEVSPGRGGQFPVAVLSRNPTGPSADPSSLPCGRGAGLGLPDELGDLPPLGSTFGKISWTDPHSLECEPALLGRASSPSSSAEAPELAPDPWVRWFCLHANHRPSFCPVRWRCLRSQARRQ